MSFDTHSDFYFTRAIEISLICFVCSDELSIKHFFIPWCSAIFIGQYGLCDACVIYDYRFRGFFIPSGRRVERCIELPLAIEFSIGIHWFRRLYIFAGNEFVFGSGDDSVVVIRRFFIAEFLCIRTQKRSIVAVSFFYITYRADVLSLLIRDDEIAMDDGVS